MTKSSFFVGFEKQASLMGIGKALTKGFGAGRVGRVRQATTLPGQIGQAAGKATTKGVEAAKDFGQFAKANPGRTAAAAGMGLGAGLMLAPNKADAGSNYY